MNKHPVIKQPGWLMESIRPGLSFSWRAGGAESPVKFQCFFFHPPLPSFFGHLKEVWYTPFITSTHSIHGTGIFAMYGIFAIIYLHLPQDVNHSCKQIYHTPMDPDHGFRGAGWNRLYLFVGQRQGLVQMAHEHSLHWRVANGQVFDFRCTWQCESLLWWT